MNAAYRSAWLVLCASLFAVASAGAAFGQDDPFGAEPKAPPAGQADAPEAKKNDKAETIIRKVDPPQEKKLPLLPHQKKELMQRLIREIQTHLDDRETELAEKKLAELLDIEMTDSEVRDIRRRFSRFLLVETDQRVLDLRRRKPTGALNLIAAIRRMLEINRADEAGRYLAQLQAEKITDGDRYAMFELVGESFLRSLIRDRKLGAQGAEFAQAVIDSAKSRNSINSPVVASLKSTRLNTPADQLDSIDKLLRYGAIDDAREVAEQLAKREMTLDEMAELQQQVGSAPLLMLIREKRLGEAPAAFANKVLQASSLVARDPARLAEAVKRMLDGDAAAKRAAAADLVRGGEAAAAALVKAVGDAEKNRAIEDALVALDDLAASPLVAALQADDKETRELAARALARMDRPDLRVYLLKPLFDPATSDATRALLARQFSSGSAMPTPRDAQLRLRQEWDRAFDAMRPGVVALDTPIHEWEWSSEANELVHQPMTEGQARRWKLARISSELLAVAPEDPEARRLAAMSLAEVATADAPAYEIAESSSWAVKALEALPTAALEQGLTEGLRRERVFALLGLLQLLAKKGDESLLAASGDQRAITKLLAHPHPRVRAAAIETILKLTPTTPFAGSSQLVEALRGFAQLRARPTVIVLDPKPSRAQQCSMLLLQAGWEAESFTKELDLVKRIAELPDAQIVLVSEEMPDLNGLLQRLRRDPRLALAPVGIMADVDNLPGASRLTAVNEEAKQSLPISGMGLTAEALVPKGLNDLIENPKRTKDWVNLDSLTRVTPYALSEEVLGRAILQLSQLRGDAPQTPDDQLNLAVQAFRWMGYIAADDHLARIFDLTANEAEAISALNFDALAIDAAPVVGGLATAKAQAALVDLASQEQREISLRQAAAAAFKAAVEKRGLLLTKGAIALQYDRYNQSRDADRATQKVLGEVLDAIEIPWKKRQAVSTAAAPRK